MDEIEAKLISARTIRKRGFEGPVVAHALYDDHVDRILEAGATHAYLTMQQAGVSLADHALRALNSPGPRAVGAWPAGIATGGYIMACAREFRDRWHLVAGEIGKVSEPG